MRLLLLGLCVAAAAPADEVICGYTGTEVVAFDASAGLTIGTSPVGFTSINVAQPGSGVSSMDLSNPICQAGLCAVFMKGANLEKLYPDPLVSTNLEVFCFFGTEQPCSSVPTPIRSDELQCSSPTLPPRPGIAPFGVFVLAPGGVGPGTLYLASGLEMTFYDSSVRPTLLRVHPPASDVSDVPEAFAVVGLNLGPGLATTLNPIQCLWDDLEPSLTGSYEESEQTAGDDETQINCPAPAQAYTPGSYARLRVSISGALPDAAGRTVDEVFSGGAGGGAVLVFFDRGRKPRLHGHSAEGGSEVYGDVGGGARLVLEGDNFAPLGEQLVTDAGERTNSYSELQCVFGTRGRTEGNSTFNETAVPAEFLSPNRLACTSPDYAQQLGPTYVYINTTYNTSLFAEPPEARQTVPFVYYDASRPPAIRAIEPRHAPTTGRGVRFVGGEGPWGLWRDTAVAGGVLLLGSNLAPTRFLWCAFGMDGAQYETSRGPWRWTRGAYLNATAMRCEVPRGFVGDYAVAASTDDARYSDAVGTITYHDTSRPATLFAGQQIAISAAESGFLLYGDDGGIEVEEDASKPTITLAGENFAPLTERGLLLCRFGPAVVERPPAMVPENNTDPINLLENVVHASFVSGTRMRCRTPRREAGTRVAVHVSTGGVRNFSSGSAVLTYYDGAMMVPGGGPTQVSRLEPAHGPIAGGTVVVAHGSNFAPTGWSADAIGTAADLACVLNPLNPSGVPPGWATEWHRVPAIFIDYNRVICNISRDT